jgi:hypothetical protein
MHREPTAAANTDPSKPLPSGPSAPAVAQLRSLWDDALANLPASQQAVLLQSSGSGTPLAAATTAAASIDIASLCAVVAKQREACELGQWKFTFRGHKTIVLRDTASKILAWLDKFKQVGDMAIQYDPHHFALPWALVRLLLEVGLAVFFRIFYWHCRCPR